MQSLPKTLLLQLSGSSSFRFILLPTEAPLVDLTVGRRRQAGPAMATDELADRRPDGSQPAQLLQAAVVLLLESPGSAIRPDSDVVNDLDDGEDAEAHEEPQQATSIG